MPSKPYTKDHSTWFPGWFRIIDDAGSGYAGQTFGSPIVLTRRLDGVTNPDWQKQVEAMQNATTPMTATWQRVSGGSCHFNTIVKAPGWAPKHFEVVGFWPIAYGNGFEAWDSNWNSQADAKASNKFLGKVRNSRVMVSGPTFLGEIRETLRMIRRPAGLMLDTLNDYASRVKAIKRRRKRRPLEWVREAGDLWLEGTFGWIPLMRDISDARDAYNSLIDKERVVYISAGGVDQKNLSDQVRYDGLPAVGSWYAIKTATTNRLNRHVVRYRGAMLAQAATTARDRYARFGFTPSEFIPTAWELLPWSFLVDYFASIGDVLTGVVTDTSNVRWVNKSDVRISEKVVTSDVLHPRSDWPTFTYDDSSSPGVAKFESKTVTRSAGIGVPMPQMVYKLSQSDMHLANIAALLATVGLQIHPQNVRPRTYRL